MAVEPLFGTRAQKAFIGIILLQTIVVLSMIAITFNKVDNNVKSLTDSDFKTLPCYLALFVLAEIFELLMAWDALRLRNTIQLGGILIFHAGLIVFSSLQAYETAHSLERVADAACTGMTCKELWVDIRPYLIIAPAAIGLSWVGMMFCVRALYFEFGWAIFHVVGANPQMKTMYQWYQLLICLLKFDFFCFAGVTMQMLIVVLTNDPTEYALTIAAIPVVLVLLVFCGIAVRREIKWLMALSCLLMLASESYFYKLVRFYQPSQEEQYKSTRATLTFFTIVAFIVLFATFANGLRCFADFDKGLLDSKTARVHPRTSQYSAGKTAETPANLSAADRQSYFSGQPLQPRMSIE